MSRAGERSPDEREVVRAAGRDGILSPPHPAHAFGFQCHVRPTVRADADCDPARAAVASTDRIPTG